MKVKLSDLYDIGSSKRVFQSEWRDSGVPFYRAREIAKLSSDGTVDNELFIDEELYSEYIEKYGKPEAGDVMVTGVGTLGVCYVVKPDDRFYFKDGNILWFKQKAKDKILPEYLVKAFDSKEVKDFIDKNSSGTTVGTFTIQTAKKMEISLPSLGEQREIIDKVTKIETIIKQRKQELQLLDDLIKARFVEMFGDARENPNGYTTVPFIDIIEYMGDIGSNGANKVVVDHLDMKDEEDYAMMVRFTNFTKNDFTDDVKYVSKEAYDFFKKSQIFGGELIICKIGSAGQNYVMPYLNRPVSLGLNQIMVRIKENILMPYLYQYLHTDYGEFLISGCINGAVTKTITKTELKKIPVMLPPMELQNEFAEFVKQVDKSKVAVQKALDETQILFDSLMQKYFG